MNLFAREAVLLLSALACVASVPSPAMAQTTTTSTRSYVPRTAPFQIKRATSPGVSALLSANPILRNLPLALPGPDIGCAGLVQLGGRALSTIALYVSGRSGAIHPNNYFSGHPALAHFQYSTTGALPTTTTPSGAQQSGEAQNSPAGFKPTVLELQSIDCTSKFGGSLRFSFRQVEDIQYEVGNGTYVWDLQNLQINLYAVPNAFALNGQGRYFSVPVSVEFVVPTSQTYVVGAWQTGQTSLPNRVRIQGDQIAALEAELQALAIDTTLVQRLAIGIARAVNAPQLTANVVVDAVQISDGRLDLVTRQGIRIAEVSMRIDGIDVNTEPGGEEFYLTVYEGTGPGYTWRALRRDMKLGQNERSSWFKVGSFAISAGCATKTYSMHYDLVERDDAPVVGGSTIFTSPDWFRIWSHNIAIACAPLNTAPANAIADEGSLDDMEVWKTNTTFNEQAGTMSVSYRVTVVLR
jgi:hypothetical protein